MFSDYKSKFVSPQQAARLAVRSGDWVDYGFGGGFPELMDRALAERRDELTDVKIRGGLVIRPRIEVVEQDPEQKAFHYYSWHIGDYERKLQSRGLCTFMPMLLRYLPQFYRHHIRVDVAFVPVSKPDEKGYCGLGISNYAWRTIFEAARTVVFEINEHLAPTGFICPRPTILWKGSMNLCPPAPTRNPPRWISRLPSGWSKRFPTGRCCP